MKVNSILNTVINLILKKVKPQPISGVVKLNITIPAYNEEKILEKSVATLLQFCEKNIEADWQIIIADNNSNDTTATIGKTLALRNSKIKYCNASVRGKGAAIKFGWTNFPADIYCFMDADLATDLISLPELINSIAQGQADMAVGSRFHKLSQVQRSILRKIFSLGYKTLLKLIIGLKVSDAPCGFKAINQKVQTEVLPQTTSTAWFFDSELVIMAEKLGYKIKEVPVTWHDPRENGDSSRVNPFKLTVAYTKEVLALRKRLKKM